MDTSQEWIIIGIGGVTCGGKTSLANKLMEVLSPVYVFHQDKYFFPDDSPKHVKCATLAHNNYDIITSLDMDGMYSDVLETMRGGNKAHEYSLEEEQGRFTINGKKFIIVEGFTVLNFKPILEICNLRYFYVLEYGECRQRRIFRLYDPPDIDGYFELCVWPEHLKYRAEIEKDKRVKLLDGTDRGTFNVVMADVRALASCAS